ncbi:MAG: hypothetical protein ACK5ZT_11730 [Sphingobacteriaceae bacterium]
MRKTLRKRETYSVGLGSACSCLNDSCVSTKQSSNCDCDNNRKESNCKKEISSKKFGYRSLKKISLRNRKSESSFLEERITAEKKRIYVNSKFEKLDIMKHDSSSMKINISSIKPQQGIIDVCNKSECNCNSENENLISGLSSLEKQILLSSLLTSQFNYNNEYKLSAQNRSSKQYLNNGIVIGNQILLFEGPFVIGTNPSTLTPHGEEIGCFPCNYPGCCGNVGSITCYKGCCLLVLYDCLIHDILCWKCKPELFCGPDCKPGMS